MGLLDRIKADAQKSGTNKAKLFFVKEGEKRRVRFLQDIDDGFEIVFHDNFDTHVNIPCQTIYGRSCEYCEAEGLRTRSLYAWSVWDYDAKEVKLFMYPVNNCSPVSMLVSLGDTYGTITDRDYVISTAGKQTTKSYSVIPMDKAKFRNDKAKPFSEKAALDLIDKAYPANNKDSEEYANSTDYEEKSAKELYSLCKDRDIEALPKKSQSYYVDLLLKYDEKQADDHGFEDDDWGEDGQNEDYTAMTPKELYDLCKEKNIEALPKKLKAYYINLLEEFNKAQEDWADEDEDEEEWDS